MSKEPSPPVGGITINISPEVLSGAYGGNSTPNIDLYKLAERAQDSGKGEACDFLLELAQSQERVAVTESKSQSKPLEALFEKAASSQFFNLDEAYEMYANESGMLDGMAGVAGDESDNAGEMREISKAVPRKTGSNGDAAAPRETPSRYSPILDAAGAYSGIKDPRNATGRHMQLLHATSMMPPIWAILNTRAVQVAKFHQRNDSDPRKFGWKLSTRDPLTPITPAIRKRMELICDLIEHGGFPRTASGQLRRNPITGEPGCWDGAGEEKAFDFGKYLHRTTVDLLVYDGAPVRKEPGRVADQFPVAWCSPADASRIWPALATGYYSRKAEIDKSLSSVQWVEVEQKGANRVVREFDWQTMDVLMQRPRLDPAGKGFGISPIEIGLEIAAALMGGIEFQASYFSKNYIPLAILEVVGQTMKNPQAIEYFKRQMRTVGGPEGMWKMLLLPFAPGQQNAGVKVHSLRGSMGATSELALIEPWFAFLFNIFCSLCTINSEEVGWSAMKTGGPSLSQGGQEITIDHSWQKGVVPLMEFHASAVYRMRVQPFDPDNIFQFTFTGLDRKNAKEEEELRTSKQGRGFTPNQLRDEDDEEQFKVPMFASFFRSIADRFDRAQFESTQEWRKQIDSVYEKAFWAVIEARHRDSQNGEMKDIDYLALRMQYSPWADYTDQPIGNPAAMDSLSNQLKSVIGVLQPQQAMAAEQGDPWGHDAEEGMTGYDDNFGDESPSNLNSMNADTNATDMQGGPDNNTQSRMVAQTLPGTQQIAKSIRHKKTTQDGTDLNDLVRFISGQGQSEDHEAKQEVTFTDIGAFEPEDERPDDLYTMILNQLDR